MAGIAHEVKLEILGKVKAGEAVLELSKQYGVSDKTIYRWLKEQLGQAVSFAEYNRVRRENRELKQILGVLTFELEKVKKSSDLAQAVLGKYPGITRQLVARVF